MYKLIPVFFLLLTSINSFCESKVVVRAFKVQKKTLYETYNVIGQCKNDLSKDFYANVAGNADEVYFKDGDKVRKGEVILAIDRILAESYKYKSESYYKLALSTFSREEALFKSNITTKASLEKIKEDLEVAKLQLAEIYKKYEDMIIQAPFDGEIGLMKLKLRDKVNIGDYLFCLVNKNSSQSVFVELPENLGNKISSNTKILILDSNRNVFEGKLESISPYLSDKGVIDAKINVKNSNNSTILHGSYVNVELYINEHDAHIAPETSILRDELGSFLFKIEKNKKLKKIYIDTGIRSDSMIEVVSNNVAEGDLILLEGFTKIQDGLLVEVENL